VLRAELTAIETALDDGSYRPGPWQKLTDELRGWPQAERLALAPDVTRISRKLHLRRHRYTVAAVSGILLEAWAGIIGGVLVADGVARNSNGFAIAGMMLWVVSFEPLLKIGTGTLFGVSYDYAYLYGWIEPRFKMSFGSYLAISPFKRTLMHIVGVLGSPLAALIAARIVSPSLPMARLISWAVFALVVLMNLGALTAALAGVRRIGSIQLPDGSPTMALVELRSWRRTTRGT
jgi:hypothetical protein